MEAKEDGAAHIMVLLAFGPCIVSHDIFSLQVRLPSGGEVHEFVLPLGYTVDQVKVNRLSLCISDLRNIFLFIEGNLPRDP